MRSQTIAGRNDMGWYPVNSMTLVRDSNTREIIVTWHDDVIGKQEQRFTWEQKDEALEFARKQFNSLAM